VVERGQLVGRGSELPGLSRTPLLDTPEPALNQAFAWAIRRDPAGVRADPVDGWVFGEDDFEELVESARAFRRVGPSAGLAPQVLLHQVVAGLFGIRADGAGGRFEVTPWVVGAWRAMALRRVRCHRTVLDVEVRPRMEWVTVRLEVGFGPAIPVSVQVRNTTPIGQVTIDEVPVQGDRAVLTLQQQHEVTFFLGSFR
jgi:hypothetical protein